MTRCLAALLAALAGCGGAGRPPTEPLPGDEEGEGPVVAVALRMAEAPTDEPTGTPQTRVLLVRIVPDEGRATEEVGTFQGACTPATPREGAILEVRCWWAGFGAEVFVRRESDALVAYRIQLDEHAPAGVPEEVARMPLPDDARLDLIH